jgi:cytoskeleton protein RodZ
MGNIGERLQHARKRAGLSLTDISVRTKIRTMLLEAIEREDFARLPPGLLARGFLRAYAREVGLDPDSVVRQFQDEFEPEAERRNATAPVEAAEEEPYAHRTAWRRAWPAQVFAAAAVAGLAGAVFIGLNGPSEVGEGMPAPIASMGAGAEVPVGAGGDAEHVEDAPLVDAVVAATVEPSRDDFVTVEIAAADVVWLEATADGAQVIYQLLEPGERRVIEVSNELVMTVGDAAAFRYSINGIPGVPLGPPAAVRVLRITPENYAAFQTREPGLQQQAADR